MKTCNDCLNTNEKVLLVVTPSTNEFKQLHQSYLLIVVVNIIILSGLMSFKKNYIISLFPLFTSKNYMSKAASESCILLMIKFHTYLNMTGSRIHGYFLSAFLHYISAGQSALPVCKCTFTTSMPEHK